MAETVWKARKRIGFLGLPWTFTVYTLTTEKLLIDSGFFNRKEDETRLYRILDMTLTRSFGQRLMGLGTITCNTSDTTTPILVIKNIKNSAKVKETLSDLVEKERVSKRVSAREYMADHDHCDGHEFAEHEPGPDFEFEDHDGDGFDDHH